MAEVSRVTTPGPKHRVKKKLVAGRNLPVCAADRATRGFTTARVPKGNDGALTETSSAGRVEKHWSCVLDGQTDEQTPWR